MSLIGLEEGIGKKVDVEQSGQRDAIHIAVVALEATNTLEPGQRVRIHRGLAGPAMGDDWQAIVDPYLDDAVKVREVFWAFVRPGMAQKLRHNWSMPGHLDDDDEFFSDSDFDDECQGCYD